MTSSTESVLLVQCCHLPQFFYLAKKLRQRHPEWNLSALVNDRPHVRSYLELFPPFDHLFFFDKNLPETLDAFDQILFPLLNRGYLRIKRAAWRLPGTAYEIDFQGERRALSPGTLVRSFARPLHRPPKEFVQYLEDFPPSPILSPILFFPTDEDSKAAEAIGRLQDSKIAAKSIVVFCREDKRSFYQALPTVEAVWTYAPGISLRHLKPWVRLLRTRVDLVCAVFSGRPIFLLQKFLFLTLRARNRLVFNEDLNCYMLRGHLAQFLQSQGGHRERGHSALIFAVRMALKGFLFVPRFLYLILWAAVVTVRARRRISKERRAANPSPDC